MKRIILVIVLLATITSYSQNPAKFKNGVNIQGIINADFSGVAEDTVVDSLLTWTGTQFKWVKYTNLVSKINPDISITESQISDLSHTTNFDVSSINQYQAFDTNILDGATYTQGFYLAGGNEVSFASFQYSEVLPVYPSTNYIKSVGAAFSGIYLDANQNYISDITGVDFSTDDPHTTPSNCYFVRVNTQISEVDPYFKTSGFYIDGLTSDPSIIEEPLNFVNGLKYSYLEDTNISQIMSFDYPSYSITGNICVIGDSTISPYAGAVSVASLLYPTGTKTDISVAGHTINQQLTDWNALSSGVKTALNYVFVQIGLNDLQPAEAASVALTRYQNLIDQINLDAPSAIIVVGTMTPAKQRLINLYGGLNGLLAWNKQLDMNDAILGNGDNAITGTDFQTETHFEYLADLGGNLRSVYDTGDAIHPTSQAKKIIAHSWLGVIADDLILNRDYLNPFVTTATALDISNLNGNLVSMASANAGTTYTISSSATNGYAQVLINTTTEPTVTGATKTNGATWVTGTDMYMVVWNNGNRNEFYFLEI